MQLLTASISSSGVSTQVGTVAYLDSHSRGTWAHGIDTSRGTWASRGTYAAGGICASRGANGGMCKGGRSTDKCTVGMLPWLVLATPPIAFALATFALMPDLVTNPVDTVKIKQHLQSITAHMNLQMHTYIELSVP